MQEAVFFAVADLLNLEVDLLFFDTTSTYFERDEPDPAGEHGEPAFRAYGHSQGPPPRSAADRHRPGRHPGGHPGARAGCWPGNTNDSRVLPEVKDDLRGWRLGRVVTVVDRGFSSDENLDYLRRAGGHWIAGERMRDGNPDAQAALSRQGRYQTVRDNLRVKEVASSTATPGSAGSSATTPSKPNATSCRRDEALARLEAELERIAAARAKAEQRRRPAAAHHRAECALRDHPTLGRWLRQTTSGRLRPRPTPRSRPRSGWTASTCSPPPTRTCRAEDVALGYKNLLEAERGFRDLKSTLELRPVFHRVEHRIRAHVLLCWLALLLIRVAERRTGLTWRRIELELQRLHAVTLTGTAGTVRRPPHSPTRSARS